MSLGGVGYVLRRLTIRPNCRMMNGMKHSAARSAAAPDLRPVPGLEELDVWMEGSSDLDGPLWVQFLPGEADAVIDAL